MAIYDTDTLFSQLGSHIFGTLNAPVGLAEGIAGFTTGTNQDWYVNSASIKMEVMNQNQYPIKGTLWMFSSRYDNGDDPRNSYNNSLAIAGTIGTSWAAQNVPDTDDLIGSTPFNYRQLCQNYHVKRIKSFEIKPGQTKVFKYSQKKLLHVTTRITALGANKLSKFFHFNMNGPPINDTVDKTHISAAPGQVDIICTDTHEYTQMANPYTYRDTIDTQVAYGTPSIITLNAPNLLTTTIPA